jgi:hypothetical protein
MRKINNILIGLLWLLAMVLAATFWFNTKYGFNIFSGSHWQYLAYMQATTQPIKPSFYISFVFLVLMTVIGLYILLQPRRRHIVLPVIDRSTPSTPKITPAKEPVSEPQTITQEPTKTEIPQETDKVPTESVSQPNPAVPGMLRPPRLNIPNVSRAPMPTVPLKSTPSTTSGNTTQDYTEIQNIFESAGYIVKGSPRIKGVQTSVIAIGNEEILWIGANGISTADMQRTIDTLNGVFTDTLEDIEIHIHAFIIGATDNDTGDIMLFANTDELRAYISSHPNSPGDDEDDAENMDAYSAYIGTVVDYIRKI